MELSVVILNYNVRHFLELCLQSVLRATQNLSAEIIVVDNASADDSCAFVRAHFPQVKLLALDQNYGFPKGNNLGVLQAKGDYLCILNPDTVVAEDTFEKLLDFSRTKTHLGAIGCRLVDGKGVFLPESKRGIPTPWVAFTKVTGLYKIFPQFRFANQYYAQHIDEHQTAEVEILVGAFMFMKRQVYVDRQGFDEGCFMYADDIDLSYRLLQSGLKNYYFSDTTVVHFKGESTLRDGTYFKRFSEAMQFFYQKHFHKPLLFSVFLNIGVWFFAKYKQNEKPEKWPKPETYWVFSSDETFIESLRKITSKNTKRLSNLDRNEVISQLTEEATVTGFIFDEQTISYAQMIALMCEFAKKNITFTFRLKRSNAILGSNSSRSRGEVWKLE